MMNKRCSSLPKDSGLPTAEAVCPPDVEMQSTGLELLDSKSQPNESNGPFQLVHQETQQYWGRFDLPMADAVQATYSSGPVIMVSARMDDRMVRMQFIRKVYGILSLQLLATFAICFVMATDATSIEVVKAHLDMYPYTFLVSFACLIALSCFKRSYPTNVILLSIFTVSMATAMGVVSSLYAAAGAGDLVLEAVALTASVFLALTLFTLQSKWDFSFMGAGLGMCLWVLILWGFFGMMFGMQTGSVYALGGSILFSGFIIYDTYMICERLDPEDYVVAAIELYLDLINLFLHILRLLSRGQRRN